ncbi:MAG: LysE family transporter, partial [Firmicutes bacterium]|nr:LysE family transporter [Bacillota bacterium]
MDLGPLFATAFAVGLSGAMMPGPLLTLTIAESARRGWKVGPLVILGHGLLEGILVLVLVVGFAAVLTRQGVTTAIAILGGGFLVYMGYGMVRDAWHGRVALPAPEGDPGNPAPSQEDGSKEGLHPVL